MTTTEHTSGTGSGFNWESLTTLVPPEAQPHVAANTDPVVVENSQTEATYPTVELVTAVEGTYRRNVGDLMQTVKGRATAAAEGLDIVPTRVETLAAELPRAKRAIGLIDRYLTTADTSVPVPVVVEDAAYSLFGLTNTYDNVKHVIRGDYDDQFSDVHAVTVAMRETEQEASGAQAKIAHEAASHEKDTLDRQYLAAHGAVLRKDNDKASYGAKLATEVETALDMTDPHTLASLPDGPAGTAYAQDLLNDLRAMGSTPISMAQVRADFTKMQRRVAEIEQAGGTIMADVTHLKDTLAKIEGVVAELAASPLLAEQS
jgi:hypothetical protein